MKFTKNNILRKENILILLSASVFISISLFEALIAILLLWEIYLLFKRNLSLKGSLSTAIFLITLPALLSTAIYGKGKDILGAIEQTVFMFIYFLKDKFKLSYELFVKLNKTVLIFATLDAIYILYNFFTKNKLKPFWGGIFEIGNVLSLASVSALVMTFVEKDKKLKALYFSLFILFISLIFLSTKRSSLIGISFMLLTAIVLIIKASNISKKIVIVSLAVIVLIFSIGTAYVFYKVPKYQTFFKIITFDKSITEQQLNVFTSNRWNIGKKGLEVIKKDIKQKNILPLLIGHGYNSGKYLNPPSPVGRTYESVIFISELIRYGIVGLLGMLLMMFFYFRHSFKVKVENHKHLIAVPFLTYPAYFLTAAIFTNFWDALVPVSLLFFGIAEEYYNSLSKS